MKSGFWAWKHKFIGLATHRGYHELLNMEPDEIPNHIERDASAGEITAEEKDLQEKNKRGFSELMLSMEKDADMRLVLRARTKPDYPDGNLPKAWIALTKKYEPNSREDRESLKQELYTSSKMAPSKDPEAKLEELQKIQQDLMEYHGVEVEEQAVVTSLLKSLPEEYEMTKEIIKNELEKNEDYSLEEVMSKLKAKFRHLKLNGRQRYGSSRKVEFEEEGDEEEEKGLAAYVNDEGQDMQRNRQSGGGDVSGALMTQMNMICQHINRMDGNGSGRGQEMDRERAFAAAYQVPRMFKGLCRYCGKQGHMMSECPELKRPGATDNGPPVLICTYCGRRGHSEATCFRKESNAHLRPEWWDSTPRYGNWRPMMNNQNHEELQRGRENMGRVQNNRDTTSGMQRNMEQTNVVSQPVNQSQTNQGGAERGAYARAGGEDYEYDANQERVFALAAGVDWEEGS